MQGKRVLIVEPDSAFGLSLASVYRGEGFATAVCSSAGDAEREIQGRVADLVVIRAELPDLSGFSLCGRLRRAHPGLPVVLFSSESSQEALAEHARTPSAAGAYLAMPLDTAALLRASRDLLAVPAPLDLSEEALVEETGAVEVRVGATAPAAAPQPPPVPRRERREGITDEDRLFLARAFQSIADRRADLVAESRRRRPPPPRHLLATPEGKLSVLREELKAREAQVARLAQIWEARERELAQVDDRLHEKEVEIQELKLQVDEQLRKLAAAREHFLEKEREHGASVEGLLLEKFSQEKELIEVVAGKERRVNELEREVRLRDDDLARRKVVLDAAEAELQAARGREAALAQRVRELEEHEAQLQAQMDREREAAAAAAVALQARIDEREQAIREREDRLVRLDEELRAAREGARAREEDLLHEIRDHADHVAALEREAEEAATEEADREAAMEVAARQARDEAQAARASREQEAATWALQSREWEGRLAAAEARVAAAEATLKDERRQLQEEAARREAARVQEAQRWQATIQEAARRIEAMQRELARRPAGPPAAPTAPAAAPDRSKPENP